MQTKLLINGKLTVGGGKVEEVLDPATGKVLARVAEASREQVNAAMPHGGLKRSGYGKDLSMYALEDYSVVRHVMAKL
jgi:acyl-CoA reductase-like NAD-dependent aldehyde dehydrogenase